MDDEKQIMRFTIFGVVIIMIVWLAIIATVAFVAVHFISKYW